MTAEELQHDRQYWSELADRISMQENAINFEHFGYTDAWRLGKQLVDIGYERRLPIAIAVVFGRQCTFHAALDGSTATNDDWLRRKFSTVALLNTSSYAAACRNRATGTDFFAESGYAKDEFAMAGGAVPLRVCGSLIGAVGVSGLDEADDHALVIEALEEYRSLQR